MHKKEKRGKTNNTNNTKVGAYQKYTICQILQIKRKLYELKYFRKIPKILTKNTKWPAMRVKASRNVASDRFKINFLFGGST